MWSEGSTLEIEGCKNLSNNCLLIKNADPQVSHQEPLCFDYSQEPHPLESYLFKEQRFILSTIIILKGLASWDSQIPLSPLKEAKGLILQMTKMGQPTEGSVAVDRVPMLSQRPLIVFQTSLLCNKHVLNICSWPAPRFGDADL